MTDHERHLAKRRERYHASSAERERAARWRAENPEKAKAAQARHLDKNRDKINARRRAQYRDDPTSSKANARRWQIENRERAKAALKKWKADNPDRVRLHAAVARRRRRAGEGRFTVDDVLDRMRWQKRRCAGCKCRLGKVYHVDHIVAVSKGGSNHPNNIQILCKPCNLSKYTKSPEEFYRLKGMLL